MKFGVRLCFHRCLSVYRRMGVGFPACITGDMTSIPGSLTPGGGLPPRWSASGGLGRPPSGTRKAGGTHPTGMLSCLEIDLIN